MDSKFVQGFTTVPLRLPHTGRVVQCQPLPLAKAAEWLRRYDRTRLSDEASAEVIEQFPQAVGVPAEEFEGLTPKEFLGVVGDFFSVDRSRERAAPSATPGPSGN